ncbi:hypothetical protein Spith_1257 [Spirochaeta thermophila DSM 6578]|uniref:Uncharacterized protein n=1 Tax=Winmispira thermophila (strain ATCC 700085 / DSM 6578 / Z-1203) TaxID=869211 RepID=G0GEW6_WINT7|nr:hypothetical protein [Spirochaeta thermophila]AEJ61522.1 hypothetical protein Spith_1257 [Spirochaeta thermophila DSM 6578]
MGQRVSPGVAIVNTVLGLCVLLGGIQPLSATETPPVYPEIGLVLSGCLVNLTLGLWWGPVGIRASGMYWGSNCHQLTLSLGYTLSDTPMFHHSINLTTSQVTGEDPGARYRYWATGLSYSLVYRGLFLELGLLHPWRDEVGNLGHTPVVPHGAVGYLYRFRSE